jgi:DnaJ-class molecular chaperone
MPNNKNQLNLETIETEKRRAQVAECLIYGQSDRHMMSVRFGVSEATIIGDVAACYERWIGDRPKKVRQLRERSLKVLEMVQQLAFLEFTKSKQSSEAISTTYNPITCKACKGQGKVTNAETRRYNKCVACGGKGEIMEEVITKTSKGKCGDPKYLQLVVMVTREVNRVLGITAKKRTTLNKIELAEEKHLHVHLNQILQKWDQASDDDLLVAKQLVDKLSSDIHRRREEDE